MLPFVLPGQLQLTAAKHAALTQANPPAEV